MPARRRSTWSWSILAAPDWRRRQRRRCRPWSPDRGADDRGLNIDDHLGFPLGAYFLDAQAVIGDRLDFVLHVVPRTIERLAPGACSESVLTNLNLKCAEE